MTYVGVLPKTSIERIFDQVFEQFRDQDLFQYLLSDENIQLQIKNEIFEAIESGRLLISSLKDPEFAQGLVLAFVTSYVMQKNNIPTPDLKVLFMKEEDDPILYQSELRNLCRALLIHRCKLEPKLKFLTDKEREKLLEKLLDNIMDGKNPTAALKLLLNYLLLIEQQKELSAENESELTLSEKEKEEKQLENEMRLFGYTHIPGLVLTASLGELLLGNFEGFVNQGIAERPASIMSDQRVRDYSKSFDFSQMKIVEQSKGLGAVAFDSVEETIEDAVKHEAHHLRLEIS